MLSFNWNNTGVTVELGELVDSGVDIWAFEYPVPAQTVAYNGKTAKVPFDKKAFEQKIIDHYRFRQIGQETVGRWLHYFRSRIKEIMPYYVQLYEFEAKWFNVDDPLESYNLVETFEESSHGSGTVTDTNSSENSGTVTTTSTGENSGTSTGNTSETTDKTIKFSDTPQGSIANIEAYMTNATKENGSSSGTSSMETTSTSSDRTTGTSSASMTGTAKSSSNNTGATSHTLTRRGNIGVQPLGTEVNNIRDAFINIDLMVINELKDLFLQVY